MKNLITNNNYSNLKNLHKGNECIIIACGPSLSSIDVDLLKSKIENKIVFCIKQSVLLFEDVCDVHFNNFCNYQIYNLRNDIISCLVWWDNNQKIHKEAFKRADITLKVDPSKTISNLSTLLNDDGFEKFFKLNGNSNVLKGPGIMYEAVLPLVYYMGFSQITTFGWDIGNNQNSNQHFYNQNKEITKNISYKAGCYAGETSLILNTIPKLTNLFLKRKIDFKIISDTNPIRNNQVFKNLTFEEWCKNET